MARKKSKQGSKSRIFLLVGTGCGAVVLLFVAAGGVGTLWVLGVFHKQSDAGAANAPDQNKKLQQRIIGQWEATLPDLPGARMTLDLSSNGKLTLIGTNTKGNRTTETGTWETLSEKTDRLTIRLQFSGRPNPAEWDIELKNDNEMRVNFLTSNSAPVAYKRKS